MLIVVERNDTRSREWRRDEKVDYYFIKIRAMAKSWHETTEQDAFVVAKISLRMQRSVAQGLCQDIGG